VIVALAVAVPLIVAALLNGSDLVKVFDAVRRSGALSFVQRATVRSREATQRLVYGIDHGHGMVPVPERGHDHGRDHVHRHGMATATSTPQV